MFWLTKILPELSLPDAVWLLVMGLLKAGWSHLAPVRPLRTCTNTTCRLENENRFWDHFGGQTGGRTSLMRDKKTISERGMQCCVNLGHENCWGWCIYIERGKWKAFTETCTLNFIGSCTARLYTVSRKTALQLFVRL